MNELCQELKNIGFEDVIVYITNDKLHQEAVQILNQYHEDILKFCFRFGWGAKDYSATVMTVSGPHNINKKFEIFVKKIRVFCERINNLYNAGEKLASNIAAYQYKIGDVLDRVLCNIGDVTMEGRIDFLCNNTERLAELDHIDKIVEKIAKISRNRKVGPVMMGRMLESFPSKEFVAIAAVSADSNNNDNSNHDSVMIGDAIHDDNDDELDRTKKRRKHKVDDDRGVTDEQGAHHDRTNAGVAVYGDSNAVDNSASMTVMQSTADANHNARQTALIIKDGSKKRKRDDAEGNKDGKEAAATNDISTALQVFHGASDRPLAPPQYAPAADPNVARNVNDGAVDDDIHVAVEYFQDFSNFITPSKDDGCDSAEGDSFGRDFF